MIKTTEESPEPQKPWNFRIENLDSLDKKEIKALEEHLRGTEMKLSAYLNARQKFRLTDMNDVDLKHFNGIVKDNNTLRMFIHFHYYLGKWAAYNTILHWLNENIYDTPITPEEEIGLAIARQFKENIKKAIVVCPYCKKKVMNKDLLYYIDIGKNTMTRICWKCIPKLKNKINTDYLFK